ncbi:MAG TPA: DUF456 domain-containing protein [Anaerolineaceae bacterium]|nr:DUF456 domain-containing protein [Anaerolineaceae bacterium]
MDPAALVLLQTLALAGMFVGLFGLVVPIFPGLVIIWGSVLGYALAAGFKPPLGIVFFVIITVLMLVGSVIDNVFIGARTLQRGGSWWTILIATLAGLAGSLLLPPFGGLIGALLGGFIFEFIRHRDWRKALQLTGGMATGCGWAFIVRFIMGVIMIGLWIWWALVI